MASSIIQRIFESSILTVWFSNSIFFHREKITAKINIQIWIQLKIRYLTFLLEKKIETEFTSLNEDICLRKTLYSMCDWKFFHNKNKYSNYFWEFIFTSQIYLFFHKNFSPVFVDFSLLKWWGAIGMHHHQHHSHFLWRENEKFF